MNRTLSQQRSREVIAAVGSDSSQWSGYPQQSIVSPMQAQNELEQGGTNPLPKKPSRRA
jgi:hypothetical protein